MAGVTLRKSAELWNFRRPALLPGELPQVQFNRRRAALQFDRQYFIEEWRDISDYVIPRRGKYIGEDPHKPRRSGVILNNTGTLAARTLAAGMMTGISSPARPWFKLDTPDPGMAEAGDVKTWLKAAQDMMYLVFSKSNFYNSLHQLYGDLGTFGTGTMVIDSDYDDVIRCTVFAPGEYYLAGSYRGWVNGVYRDGQRTVQQLIQEFGDRCSQRVIDLYDRGAYDAYVDVLEVIEPNMGQVQGTAGAKGAAYLQVIYEQGVEADRPALGVKPYFERPFCAARWDLQAGDVYGAGCGIVALGDVKALQLLERRKAQAIDKLVTPPMTGPTSLKSAGASHIPGSVTYVDEAGGQSHGYRPAYEIPAQGIQAIGLEIEKHERRINEAFFKDLFLMLAQDQRAQPITAREVEERHEEKLIALGPVLERLHNELLNPAIDRVFSICHRAGLFPPAPKALEDVELKVEYISILAQAQRAIAVGAIERGVGFVGNLAGANPEALDKIDFDQAVDVYWNAIGADPSIIRTDDKVAQIRQGRQQQQAAAQTLQAGTEAANAAKVLSDAKTSDPNLLNQVLGGIGAQG